MKWKKIPNTNHEVSKCGKVRHVERKKVLKTYVCKIGYERISLYTPKGRVHSSIHRLVAMSFVKGKSKLKTDVNHIDGNKLNNKACNLEWVTKSENTLHALRGGKRIGPNKNRLTVAKVKEIKELLSKGWFQIDIAKKVGTSQSQVSKVALNKIWAWVQD